jgi:hypothetical protein
MAITMELTFVDASTDTEYFESVTLPTHMEVCGRCGGQGQVDCWEGGMTGDEMAEQGPEFFEDYMSGMYSKACPECQGRNVIEVVTYQALTPRVQAAYDRHVAEEADYRALVESERRMGC